MRTKRGEKKKIKVDADQIKTSMHNSLLVSSTMTWLVAVNLLVALSRTSPPKTQEQAPLGEEVCCVPRPHHAIAVDWACPQSGPKVVHVEVCKRPWRGAPGGATVDCLATIHNELAVVDHGHCVAPSWVGHHRHQWTWWRCIPHGRCCCHCCLNGRCILVWGSIRPHQRRRWTWRFCCSPGMTALLLSTKLCFAVLDRIDQSGKDGQVKETRKEVWYHHTQRV